MKILILMSYYNRPVLVRAALGSILEADEHHQDWHLLFGDDNSAIPGRPICEEILKDKLDQVTFVNSNMTLEDKLKHGLMLGFFCNETIRQSDADVGIMFCDDDQLYPTYLKNLSEFFTNNPDVLYCYSKIHLYNPLLQKIDGVHNLTGRYNQWSEPINPVNNVDASQVAWRLDCCKKLGAWFADSTLKEDGKPWTRDTDKSFFQNLYEKCGPCYPTGFVGQFKGVHDYQLLWHKNVGEDGLKSYDDMIKESAGVRF
jgi:hypothetical protein